MCFFSCRVIRFTSISHSNMHAVALNLVFLRRNIKIVQLWLPVNVIFVGMIWTSFFALKNLGVPMATVLKNLTNLFTILGDYTMYGKVRHPTDIITTFMPSNMHLVRG